LSSTEKFYGAPGCIITTRLWNFVPTSRRLNVVVRSPSLYPRGGPKWRYNYPDGEHPVVPKVPSIRSSPIVWNHFFVFSCSCPLTGHSWTATLFFLYDRTVIYVPPFTRLLILLLLLASGNVHPNPGPVPVRSTNLIFPCSICSREVRRTSIQCSRCKRWVCSTCFVLPGPTLRSTFSRGDVGG